MRKAGFWKTDWFLGLIVSAVMLVLAGSDAPLAGTYLGVAGEDQTVAVDLKTMKVVARIPVGNVPKRIGTLVMAAR